MEDYNGLSHPSQKLVQEENHANELAKRLTPEFLQTLHDAATFVGWDLDAIEVGKFVEKLYTMAGQSDKFKELDL